MVLICYFHRKNLKIKNIIILIHFQIKSPLKNNHHYNSKQHESTTLKIKYKYMYLIR